MKRATRKTLVQVERMNDAYLRADQARDVLASDAKQLEKIRDLKARLNAVREADTCSCSACKERRSEIHNLKNKNWRKP